MGLLPVYTSMYFRHAPKARWQLIEPGVARARSGTPSELPRVKDPVRTLPWASKEQGAVRPDITRKVRVGVGSHRARRRSCSRTPRRARCQSARRTPARSRSADERRWTVAFQKKKADRHVCVAKEGHRTRQCATTPSWCSVADGAHCCCCANVFTRVATRAVNHTTISCMITDYDYTIDPMCVQILFARKDTLRVWHSTDATYLYGIVSFRNRICS